ncbi:MAG: hypothetical protein KDA45_08910 [Planctomycetales bacterium]|nr:hypothetical protein [Planctomycetales bacterium]
MKTTAGRIRNYRHPWRLRLAAILLGLLPFAMAEVGLHFLGLPRLPPPADPFVDLHNLRPLFTAQPNSGRLEISPERLQLFRPASFQVDKPAKTFRVFALGGSTTQGEPYSTETAFPEWMRLSLAAAAPGRRYEVINCGGISYASYRVLAILREVLQYSPDLIVVYTGQNEYLERRSYEGYYQQSWGNRVLSGLYGLRIVQFARALTGDVARRQEPLANNRTELEQEVEALLDYRGGMAQYERGAAWYGPVPQHFRWSLQQMVAACQAVHVPLILVRPVTNLLDCPPLKIQIDPSLSPASAEEFEEHWAAAKAAADEPADCLPHLQRALAIDSQHAGANFLLGRLQYDQKEYVAARQSLTRAKDNDVCPLRATSAIQDIVSQVASEHQVLLLDAEALFAERSPHGIVGENWLMDHIHPTLAGHQLLGEELARLCFRAGLAPSPPEDWQRRRQTLMAEHLSGLSEAYFHRGKQRLEGLLLWTQGRVQKVRDAP